MEPTHIRLERIDLDREDACCIIVPIAGTVFEIESHYRTRVILANGRTFYAYESMSDIEEMISVAIPPKED